MNLQDYISRAQANIGSSWFSHKIEDQFKLALQIIEIQATALEQAELVSLDASKMAITRAQSHLILEICREVRTCQSAIQTLLSEVRG